MARGGKGRKKANVINYHGIVINTGNNKINVDKLFTNYVTNKKVTNINNKIARTTLAKVISYIIQKRQNVINKEKRELLTANTNSSKRRINGHIRIHNIVLRNYMRLLNAYKPNLMTNRTYNVYKYSHLKNTDKNTGKYRYRANLTSPRTLIKGI